MSVIYWNECPTEDSVLDELDLAGGKSFHLKVAQSREDLQELGEYSGATVVLLHIRNADHEVLDTVSDFPELPFVVLVNEDAGEDEGAIFRSGAVDYVVRDEEGEYVSRLPGILKKAVHRNKIQIEHMLYRQDLEKIVSDRAQVLLEANQRLTMETQHRLEFMDALRESETRYTMVFNSASDPIFVHDVEGNLLDVNDRACEWLGFKRSELLEMSLDELDGLRKVLSPQRINQLEDEGFLRFEASYQGKNEGTNPFELSSRMIEYHGQKAVVTIVRDISQRRNAEKALEESERKYHRFFQTSQDAVFMTTEEGEWVDMNQAAVDLFGYESKHELMEVPVEELYLEPEDREAYTTELKDKGFARDYRQTLRKKNGETFPALITSTMYEVDGTVIGYQGTIRDLSREQEIKEERQAIARRQEIIDQLTSEMRTTLDPDEMYESIQSHFLDLFELDYFILYGVDGERVELKYAWGSGQDLDKNFFPRISDLTDNQLSPLGLVLQEGRAVNVPDLDDMKGPDPTHYQFDVDGALLFGDPGAGGVERTRSAMLVPLIADDQEIGVIEIQCFQPDNYHEGDLQLLERIANTIAIGLQKTILLESFQKQNQRLKSLHRIDKAITENQSLPMMLDTLRDQLVALLEVDAADVLFLHPELKTLKIITQTGFRTNPLKYTDLQLGEGPAGEAASTRKMVHIPDIREVDVEFQRSPDFDREEFISYVGVPLLAKGNLVGVLEVFHRERLKADQEWLDFLNNLAGQAAIAIDQRNLYKSLRRSKEQLREAYDSIIESWAEAMELRDIETKGHAQRLVDLSVDVARRLGLGEEKLEHIRRGAYLHDVGKMGIPDRILQKKEKLTKEEREEIGQHPLYAYEILKSNEYLKPALDIPLYHHERWDGLGYPEGLKGKEIPLSARIFAVVDVWDALRSGRPYRSAWSDEKALEHIREESGKHFDPQVVRAFLKVIEEESQ